MLKREELELIRRVLKTHRLESGEAKRLYRILARLTHPDSGGDTERFIKLRQGFERLMSEKEGGEKGLLSLEDVPVSVVRDSGFAGPIEPRTGLVVCLYRYLTLGIFNHRIRNKEKLRERNDRIVYALSYWAGLYDSSFMGHLRAALESHASYAFDLRSLRWYIAARKSLITAIRLFLRYQDSAAEAAKRAAMERIAGIMAMRAKCDAVAGMEGLCIWLMAELAKEPLRLGIM